jgi:hypothetical protein
MKCMALCGVVIACCFISAIVMADAAVKTRPPLPKPKPAELAAPEPEMSAPEPETSAPQADKTGPAPVLPREKPVQPQENPFVPAPKPEAKPETEQGQEEEKPAPGDDFATCRIELGKLGAKFSVPEIQATESRCHIANPVQISAIATPAGKVDFPGGPILNCIFAKRFTAWVSDIAAPVVRAHTGEALIAIATGSSFECRNRNGDTTAKISEHASGNAIDIAAFRLADKESLPVANVQKTEDVESRWLMALRVSACGYFTTVLGPGSNAAHAEHYHFDLGIHGKSSNYRICE